MPAIAPPYLQETTGRARVSMPLGGAAEASHRSARLPVAGTAAPLKAPGAGLLQQLQHELPTLSPQLRSVARFCIQHAATLHRCRITDVAQACGTVPSSVVRLARHFGLKGFLELKLAVLEGAAPVDPVPSDMDRLIALQVLRHLQANAGPQAAAQPSAPRIDDRFDATFDARFDARIDAGPQGVWNVRVAVWRDMTTDTPRRSAAPAPQPTKENP